jgi:F420-0:gamma-glutamyl ligase
MRDHIVISTVGTHRSATLIRKRLEEFIGKTIAVIVGDSRIKPRVYGDDE